jgi:hypothetical protein
MMIMKNMLTRAFLLAFLFLYFGLNSQTIDFEWAKSASGTSLDYGQKIATDMNGNVYLTGYYLSDTISFGSITLTKEPGSSGSSAIFIAKYDPSGNVLWANSSGGNQDDKSYGITTDASGNVLITGGFQSDSISFGNITLFNASLGQSKDVFVVKYDTNGNVIWARSGAGSGGTPNDEGFGIATDGNANVYVSGYFRSSSIIFGSTTLNHVGQADIFIVKYDASGNVLWARKEAGPGGQDGEFCTGIATDGFGNFYISGHFYGNSISFGTTTITNQNNNYSLYIAKYDGSGNPLWARGASCAGDDWSLDIATDAEGNAILTGWYEGFPITFDSLTLLNSGGKDMFVVKYDTNGDILWANKATGTGNDEGIAVATDRFSNVYVTGYFYGPNITFESDSISSSNGDNIFIVKYDSSGNVDWTKSVGGVTDEQGNGIATAGVDTVFITGIYNSPTLTFESIILDNVGPYDIYLAKLSRSVENRISEFHNKEKINAYPNPFSEFLTIQLDEPLFDANLTIINYLGQKVKEFKNNKGKTIKISRDNLPSGLYFIHIIQGDELVIYKRVIIID